MRTIFKHTLTMLLVLVIGGIGGIVLDRVVMPKLGTYPALANTTFFRNAAERTTVITTTQQVVVNEDTAMRSVVNQVRGSVVSVLIPDAVRDDAMTTGAVVTEDGVVAIPAVVLAGKDDVAALTVVGADGMRATARVAGVDSVTGLAFLRLTDGATLPSLALALYGDLAVGQRVVRVGFDVADAGALSAAPGFIAAMAPTVSRQSDEARADRWQGLLRTTVDGDGIFVTERGGVAGIAVPTGRGTDAMETQILSVAAVRFSLDRLSAGMLENNRAVQEYGFDYTIATAADGTTPGSVVVSGLTAGSIAARAGLRVGDVIVSVDDVAIDATHTVPALLRQAAGNDGDRMLHVLRQGNEVDVKIVLTVARAA